MVDAKLSALGAAGLTDGDKIYVEDSLTSKAATIAELRTALGGVGFHPLYITDLRVLATNEVVNLAGHGGIVALDSVPILERTSTTTDKSLRLNWALGVTAEVYWPPIPMPPDLDETKDVSVHLVAEMDGAIDTPVIDIQAWDGVGDTEMGGDTASVTDALIEVSRTLLAADITGHPLGFLNLQLVPAAHGTDALYLYVAWLEYIRKKPV